MLRLGTVPDVPSARGREAQRKLARAYDPTASITRSAMSKFA